MHRSGVCCSHLLSMQMVSASSSVPVPLQPPRHTEPSWSASLPNALCQHQMDQHSSSPLSLMADLAARRSISDSCLARSRGGNWGVASSARNINVMMANRSGGSYVKRMVETIRCRCSEAQVGDRRSTVAPPDEECYMVAHLSVDSYYRVVIVGCGGIPAIVGAMRGFWDDPDLQECCCIALKNVMCPSSGGSVAPSRSSYLEDVESAGGVTAVIAAMKCHPQSVAVQSAACDALRFMGGLLVQHVETSPRSEMVTQLLEALNHTRRMVLLPYHRTVVDHLLQSLKSRL